MPTGAQTTPRRRRRGAQPSNSNAKTHGASPRKRGAQPGNTNTRKHGGYSTVTPPPPATADVPSIDQIISELRAKQQTIATFIAEHSDDSDVLAAAKLFREMSSTLGRLLKIRKDLGAGDQSMNDAINRALDEVAQTIGVKL